jgi:hypothetical protein
LGKTAGAQLPAEAARKQSLFQTLERKLFQYTMPQFYYAAFEGAIERNNAAREFEILGCSYVALHALPPKQDAGPIV